MLNDLQKRFLENVYDESADDWSIEYVLVEIKKDQLNAIDQEGRVKVVAGAARSMGVVVEG